jgi:hypothetical protein
MSGMDVSTSEFNPVQILTDAAVALRH